LNSPNNSNKIPDRLNAYEHYNLTSHKKQAKWQYQEEDMWIDYPSQISQQLEQLSFGNILTYQATNNFQYSIERKSFSKALQTNSQTNRKREVRRRELKPFVNRVWDTHKPQQMEDFIKKAPRNKKQKKKLKNKNNTIKKPSRFKKKCISRNRRYNQRC